MPRRIRLFHWNDEEGRERAQRLRAAGYRVAFEIPKQPDDWKRVRKDVPNAYVIDLGRLPSHGLEAALYLQQHKATRQVPVVFVDGAADKVARVKKTLPDAIYCSWRGIRGAITRALARPPRESAPRPSVLAGYSGTPLPKKLGIKPGTRVALVDAPADFAETVGALPPDAKLERWTLAAACGPRASKRAKDLTIWFLRRRETLEKNMPRMARMATSGPMWMAWPKKTSKLAADLAGNDVRRAGLGAGLVDYKVCAIDETWSGLLFAVRKG